MRDDLNAIPVKKLNTDAKSKTNEPGAAFGAGLAAVLGPGLIDRMIDSYVTPQAIATFHRDANADPVFSGTVCIPRKDLAETIKKARRLRWDQVKYAFFSGGPLTFKVEWIAEHDLPFKNPTTLVF